MYCLFGHKAVDADKTMIADCGYATEHRLVKGECVIMVGMEMVLLCMWFFNVKAICNVIIKSTVQVENRNCTPKSEKKTYIIFMLKSFSAL